MDPNDINLESLAFESLIANPNIALQYYLRSPSRFADRYFEQFPKINAKVLRFISYQLFRNGVSLQKLWDMKSNFDLPSFYYSIDTCPVENLLVGLKYGLPLSPDGNLIIWWQMDRPLNHDLLDALSQKGVDLNQICEAEGITCLQKAVMISNRSNVRMLLSHGVDTEQLSTDGKTAMTIAMEVNGQLSTGTSLHIIRDLRIYGASYSASTLTDSRVKKYIDTAVLFKPHYCDLLTDYFEMDTVEELTIQAIVDPNIVMDPQFQSASHLNNPSTYYNAVVSKNKEVVVTENGVPMAWPYYFNMTRILSNPDVCEAKRISIADMPDSDRVYRLALANLQDMVEEPSNQLEEPFISPTTYYPNTVELMLLPGM